MSLDRTEQERTAADLRANCARAGLTPDELAAWLALAPTDVDAALTMSDADPATVWLVRDAIESTLRAEGDGGDWSVLTDANRRRAQQWFALREVPAR